jgi:hypothetical protein
MTKVQKNVIIVVDFVTIKLFKLFDWQLKIDRYPYLRLRCKMGAFTKYKIVNRYIEDEEKNHHSDWGRRENKKILRKTIIQYSMI